MLVMRVRERDLSEHERIAHKGKEKVEQDAWPGMGETSRPPCVCTVSMAVALWALLFNYPVYVIDGHNIGPKCVML